MPVHLHCAVEGYPDEMVIRRIVDVCGSRVEIVHNCRGKANLDRRLPNFNRAAAFEHNFWFVIRDLDQDAACAAELCQQLLPSKSPHIVFRVVVRELESWLLADHEAFSSSFSVRASLLPADPDTLDDPKQTLFNVIARSRRRAVREEMLPRPNSGAREGPAYASRLADYATNAWRPTAAAERSESLARCIKRLSEFCKLHDHERHG